MCRGGALNFKIWASCRSPIMLGGLSYPPLLIGSPASRRKMPVPRQAALARGDRTSLYAKLGICNSCLHAKIRSDQCPITWSKGGLTRKRVFRRRLQSPASDGPPCSRTKGAYSEGNSLLSTFWYDHQRRTRSGKLPDSTTRDWGQVSEFCRYLSIESVVSSYNGTTLYSFSGSHHDDSRF